MMALVEPDLLRGLGIALGGTAFAMSMSEALLYYRRVRDPRDPWYGHRRLHYMMWVRLGIALSCVFMIGAVFSKLGNDHLTWRAPGSILVFGLLIYGMWGILRDDETIQDTGASYRVHETEEQSQQVRSTDAPMEGDEE